MTIDDLKRYFGTSYRFNALTGMSASNYMNWENYGYIPFISQVKIQRLTKGALKADLKHSGLEI